MKALNSLYARAVALLLTLSAVCLLTACPLTWAKSDTGQPVDEFLLYVDRVASYTEGAVDIYKALYAEGKISNAGAQQARAVLDRINTTNATIFQGVLAGQDLTKAVTLTNTARAELEKGIIKLKSDLGALQGAEGVEGGAVNRLTFQAPLAAAVAGLESVVSRLTYKGNGTGVPTSYIVKLNAGQQQKALALARRFEENRAERELQAWQIQ